MQPDDVRRLYDRITSLQTFEQSLQLAPDTPDREGLLAEVASALQDIEPVDGRLCLAPSPWHAFLHLWFRHADARARGSAAFFRGHNRVDLQVLSPSLFRLDPDSVRRARLAVDILVYMLERSEIIHFKGDDRRVLARTIAQHYGVATSLLDVTLDPAVAVFFASNGNDGVEGSVFTFDWQHCEALDLPIVIPPVCTWSRRLEVQRGFFLEFDSQRDLGIEDVPFEVRFRRHPGFDVRRSGAAYCPWPIDEPEAQELLDWIETSARHHAEITPNLRAEIDARAHTRVLLRHQLEVMLGFSLDAPPDTPQRERMERVVRDQLIAAIAQVDRFLNFLCLNQGGLDADRVRYLRAANRAVFSNYVEQLSRLVENGHVAAPQFTRVLEILTETE